MAKRTIEVCDYCGRQVGVGYETRHTLSIEVKADDTTSIAKEESVVCGVCFPDIDTAIAGFKTVYDAVKGGLYIPAP